MNVWIKFGGWFQCRLATDPDPSDEPRGVSGYVHALPGEPDLDRVIRTQPAGATPRSHCPSIGVRVLTLEGDNRFERHPLVGAAVDLTDMPRFEGRNHILAEDGLEAVVPCNVRISQNVFTLTRRFDDNMAFPPFTPEDKQKFSQLQATGINISPGAIGEATGIYDLGAVWKARSERLQEDLETSNDEIQRAALSARILAMSNSANARFFAARMLYSLALGGQVEVNDPDGWLPGTPTVNPDLPWPLEFWFGGWDPDALCGYMEGYLGIPFADSPAAASLTTGVARMMSDPLQRRR